MGQKMTIFCVILFIEIIDSSTNSSCVVIEVQLNNCFPLLEAV